MKYFHPKLDWRPSDWLRWSVPTCVGLSLFADESGLLDQTDVWILWYILTTHYSYILLSKISRRVYNIKQTEQQLSAWSFIWKTFHIFHSVLHLFLDKNYNNRKRSSPNTSNELYFLKTCHLYNFEIFKGYYLLSQRPT